MGSFWGGLAIGFGILLFSRKAQKEAAAGIGVFDQAADVTGVSSAAPAAPVSPCCCGGAKDIYRTNIPTTSGRRSGPSSPASPWVMTVQ